jgi:hypothetical protein
LYFQNKNLNSKLWERRKKGSPRKTWREEVQAAMTARNLEPNQWRNREEWRFDFWKTETAVKKTG